MKRPGRKTIRLIVIFVVATIVAAWAVHNAGYWLIRSDAPRHASAMVVLMGSIADRALQVADLYHNKVSDKILVVEEGMQARRLLEAHGVSLISNTTQCKNLLLQLGVDSADITVLPGDARSTADEARVIAAYLSRYPVGDTLVLVTAPAHTRRAAMIFGNAFRKAGLIIVVTTSPSPYNSFNPRSWYTRKEDIQQVLFEYIKLAAFWGVERWKSS